MLNLVHRCNFSIEHTLAEPTAHDKERSEQGGTNHGQTALFEEVEATKSDAGCHR